MDNRMRAIHPGEVLREEFMKPLGYSSRFLAQQLNLTASRVNEIVRERRGITADTAIRLGHYLNTGAMFWMTLQAEYDLKIARAQYPALQDHAIKLRDDAIDAEWLAKANAAREEDREYKAFIKDAKALAFKPGEL